MTENNGTFYCIKLINKSGERGYVMDTPEGVQLVVGGMSPYISRFDTEKQAYQFIKDRKLERGGCKAHIRTNHDLIAEGVGSVLSKEMFYLEDYMGRKCCHDTKDMAYYFKDCEVGFCAWDTYSDVEDFIQKLALPFPTQIKKIEPKKDVIN